MNVTIEEGKCVASGQCVAAAMDVLDRRAEDGIVVLLGANRPAERAVDVRHAASMRPTLSIHVEE